VQPEQVAELLGLVEAGKISGAQAKKVYASLVGSSRSAAEIVLELGMSVVSDDAELRPICQRVVDENAKTVAQYRAGKTGMLGFFVGQVMKQTQGRANPQLVSRLLVEMLGSPEGN
jgi:aspartyl-tRNA(Asn)/glutamyl-tRNA(Gln) amidotransferase subunit B